MFKGQIVCGSAESPIKMPRIKMFQLCIYIVCTDVYKYKIEYTHLSALRKSFVRLEMCL